MVVLELDSGREQEKLKERFFLLIAISPNSSIEFGFEIDRFVIILVLRFVVWRSCYQETRGWGNDNLFCCCAACEGVWWMPWQTVPMKDV